MIQQENKNIRVSIKEKRTGVFNENAEIYKETGLSIKDVLKEIKVEIKKVEREICRNNQTRKRRDHLYNYESNLYGCLTAIEYGLKTSLEIRNIFNESKSCYKDIMNSFT